MSIVHAGPAIRGYEGPIPEETVDRASFRLLVDYEVQTDNTVLRLDVLHAGKQFCAALYCSQPVLTGEKMTARTDVLLVPKVGIIQGMNVVCDRMTLVAALRGLANELESA